MQKSICIITPGPNIVPIGGYKVVYEYANRFAAVGWDVTIAFPLTLAGGCLFTSLLMHPRSTLRPIVEALQVKQKQIRAFRVGSFWFNLDSRVKCIFPMRIARSFGNSLPEGTRFVSTYVRTANLLLNVRAVHKYQLIQGRENWGGVTLEELFETYRYPMTKIVISKWLEECVAEAGATSVYIPNGLDFEYFKMSNPIERRNKFEIAMLWHRDERKRTMDVVAALKIVKAKHPELHVTAFGVPEPPADLPDWFTYVQKPDKERHNGIYNEASIFVASSEQEGWGLCPSEAMICGAALACTDIGGYRSFAENGVNALMSPVYDVEALAENVCRLIEDDAFRIRLAKAGNESIKKFTWESSFEKMKALMEKA